MTGARAGRLLGAIKRLRKEGYTVAKYDDNGVDVLDDDIAALEKKFKAFEKAFVRDLKRSQEDDGQR